MVIRRSTIQSWFSPIVYLSANWLSRIGVVLVTTAVVFWLFLLPTTLKSEETNPYIGILSFGLLPAVFFLGLALIPLGIALKVRRERRQGVYPSSFGPLSLRSVELKRLAIFVGVTTLANIIIGAQLTYSAVTYMDGVTFCGQTCHTVMQPEFAAYQNSPHSRVECVACHIGPGASFFVKSKLSGLGQVFAVTFNTYPRPIPTPVRNLRPARETCEACHWPQRFGEDRLRLVNKYADDEANTLTKTVLLMRIGPQAGGSAGIHGAHLGPGVRISYSPSDESRQTIPRVEYQNTTTGQSLTFVAADTKPEALKSLAAPRLMDCMDCHNRPTHSFQLPDRAVDLAMEAGRISPALPFVKKQAVELLRKPYKSQEEAAFAIPSGLERFYKDYYKGSTSAVYAQHRGAIIRAGQAILAIYQRNVFPAMNVTWGTYPNNIGHMDFPGCFRCHDDNHVSGEGKKITQDCNTCHHLLAMDEPQPKVLTDLGLAK